MMWCRCFVKYDFYYRMEFKKCSAVNQSWGPLSSEAAGKTDCDLETATLVSLKMISLSLSLSAAMSAHFQSRWTHTNSPSAMAFMCAGRGLTAGSRFMWNTGHIKSRWSVCWRIGFIWSPTWKLLRNSETVNITCNWSTWEGFMLLTDQNQTWNLR